MSDNSLEKIIKIIAEDYGYKNSLQANLPVDKNNNPLALYTYPALEYLNSLDFSGKKVFEFGSGNSTLYWLEKGADVVSIEHNQDWIKKLPGKNHQYIWAPQPKEYIDSISQFADEYFDIIIIDGKFSRYLCAKNAISKIKKDGLVILDNSDWYPNTAKFLKENLNFIQVDFYGLRPSKEDASVTSFFFSRNCDLKNKSDRRPVYAIGGKEKHSSLDFDSNNND